MSDADQTVVVLGPSAWNALTVPAVPTDVVDTNGTGDASFAGVLAATPRGESVDAAPAAGARQATRALGTRDLGPGLRAGQEHEPGPDGA